ncbi:helix-turn-helix transcriptional regulator [Microbacterium gorillae]|uniref:helix-turn-helix transcriptional regulator n=1 Tax=Microbacterium gorillae TaxID=1231063 RepID=UPI00059088FC|nr:helix-turn-helix transcriptional regulator [Microbacterium gorillae]
MAKTSDREEFAAYLRSRRERLRPADVGLPDGSRRRVAGLRREEVAQLAGVGLTWYTWLEQARPIAASEQVLAAIARALQLTPDERDHLYALAGLAIPDREGRSCVRATHLDLLERVLPYPAAIQTARFDVLAYNRTYRFLFNDLDDIPPQHRNCARLMFTDLHWQRAHLDADHARERIVARLRSAYGRHRDEPTWIGFISEMRQLSPGFGEIWDRGDVATEANALKRIRHARVGVLHLSMTSTWLDEGHGTRLVWFTPADEATVPRLTLLDQQAHQAAAYTAAG